VSERITRGALIMRGSITGSNEAAAAVGAVLVVDDQAAFRAVIRRLIEATSALAVIGEADSGEAAVRLVRELEPDLVLMDVRMPGLGGIAASRRIKTIRPATIVALISTMPPDALPPAAKAAADEILWKADLRPGVLDEIWQRLCV
jgi:DNA-binding NarL/FixJ family response regulator